MVSNSAENRVVSAAYYADSKERRVSFEFFETTGRLLRINLSLMSPRQDGPDFWVAGRHDYGRQRHCLHGGTVVGDR